MAVEAVLTANLKVVETLTNPALDVGDKTLTFTGYNDSKTLNATSSPVATKSAVFAQALTAGAATIDLTALVGTEGTVDGTGLKVRAVKFRGKSTNANPITITTGAANGYNLPHALFSYQVYPGCWVEAYFADSAQTIAAGDKNIDLAGTASQVLECVIVMG